MASELLSPDPINAYTLLARFTHLRQNGVNRDDAWYRVIDSVPDADATVRKAFLNLAKDWERREGHKHRYDGQKKEDTLPRSELPVVKKEASPPANPPQTQARPAPHRDSLTGTLDPARLRAYEQKNLENILDQLEENPGEIASAPRVQTRRLTANEAQDTPNTNQPPPDYFGPRTILWIYFRTRREPLRVVIPGENEFFIGRTTANAAMAPEVDLEPVGGSDYGVSRMHAAITRRNNHLLIADLRSMNYTYVNDTQLLPNEVRVLRDGDEIWFGRLQTRIRFQHV